MVFKAHVKQRYYFTELKTSPDYATIILGSWFLFANIYGIISISDGLFYSILHIMWVWYYNCSLLEFIYCGSFDICCNRIEFNKLQTCFTNLVNSLVGIGTVLMDTLAASSGFRFFVVMFS